MPIGDRHALSCLDLEPLVHAIRMDRYAVNEGMKAPHQWAPVVLHLRVVGYADSRVR